MVEPQNPHRDRPSQAGLPGPFDGFAAATAISFAMTAQALDMWFGVVSGVARASQDIFEPKDKADEGIAYSAADKSATAKAKSATRTVVADMERTVRDMAEVAVDLLGGKTKEAAEDGLAETSPAETGEVVELQVKPAAPKRAKTTPKATKQKDAPIKPEKAVKAEDESFESVTVESSPVASGLSDAPIAPVVVSGTAEPPAELPPAAAEPAAAATVTAAIMPEDFRQPRAIDKPAVPDDLKLIVGVGPKLEKVLNGLGVWTFAQVAAWTPEETAWVDDYLGLAGRIARDGWAAQADGLVKGMKAAG